MLRVMTLQVLLLLFFLSNLIAQINAAAAAAVRAKLSPSSSSSPQWGTFTGFRNDIGSTNDSITSSKKHEDIEDAEKWWETEDYTTVDIAIIGGSHAGLSTAIGLISSPKLPKCNIRIYERDNFIRKTSQGCLSIGENGKTFLGQIHKDLPQLVEQAGVPYEHSISTRIEQSNPNHEIVLRDGPLPPAFAGLTLIRWDALHDVLRIYLGKILLESQAKQTASNSKRITHLPWMNPSDPCDSIVSTGHSLVTYKETEYGVFLLFENGNVVKTQVAIGADGTFSTVRRIMFPNDSPIYFGEMNWSTVVPTHRLPTNGRPPKNGAKTILHIGKDYTTTTLASNVHDLSPSSYGWMAFINDCGGGHTFFNLRVTDMNKSLAVSGFKGRGGLGLRGVKKSILYIVQTCTHLKNGFQALPEKKIFERALTGRLPASTWISPGGRVVLLGDAAHGMHPGLGQGANQAIGSAAALVQAIIHEYKKYKVRANEDCESSLIWLLQGLQRYDKTRRPRMNYFLQIANMFGTARENLYKNGGKQESWIKWINSYPSTLPPKRVRKVIKNFDILSLPKVSHVY